jgi:hypothetical protein
MTLENSIRLMAGTLVLLSVSFGYLVSPYWFLLTLFVGLNLVQSSFTKFCPAEMVFAKLFYNNK